MRRFSRWKKNSSFFFSSLTNPYEKKSFTVNTPALHQFTLSISNLPHSGEVATHLEYRHPDAREEPVDIDLIEQKMEFWPPIRVHTFDVPILTIEEKLGRINDMLDAMNEAWSKKSFSRDEIYNSHIREAREPILLNVREHLIELVGDRPAFREKLQSTLEKIKEQLGQ